MTHCDIDHGIFFGEWTSPPDPSIIMPSSGLLILYVPLYVDDGLGITNSSSLYAWFLHTLSQRLHIVDLGPCFKFLSILILHDRPNRKIWFSSHVYRISQTYLKSEIYHPVNLPLLRFLLLLHLYPVVS